MCSVVEVVKGCNYSFSQSFFCIGVGGTVRNGDDQQDS